MIIHIVSPGETPASVAAQYSVPLSRLVYDNQLNDQNHLVPGQALLILVPLTIHEIQPGDTLYSIASFYDTTILSLLQKNPFLISQPVLIPGTFLVIQYTDTPDHLIESGGYAYPFIRRTLLRQTLPYLTSLSIFSYGFTLEGELIPIDDEPLLSIAGDFGRESVLVLTPFSEAGTFNSSLVTILVNDMEVQNRLINRLYTTVQNKGYSEVDVDFEYIRSEDRENYAAFIRNLAARMHTINVTVSVALAPKTSSDQPGLLYEGIDYNLLGEAADSVLLMTYEWGYTYGPPMAVAPIPQVRQVLDYAVTQIPEEKIFMGIPNYGYDWPLPFVRGTTAANSIGNQEAVALAAQNNVSIQYDQTAQSPFFEYSQNGTEHIVWFEDVRSIRAKFDLIKEYNFRGMKYWQLMRSFLPNWLLLSVTFRIR